MPASPINVAVRLRPDLRISATADEAFILEDPVRNQFFRLGRDEYLAASQLNGAPPTAAASLVQWLLSAGLAEIKAADSWTRPALTNAPVKLFDLCYMRFPLARPDRVVAAVAHWFGWLFSFQSVLIAAILWVLAALTVAANWTAFSASLERVLCPDQHLALVLCWLVLKVIHETAHAVACRRLGGEVREIGIALVFFAPVPYTDVSSSWRFGSRWERMAVAAAGMYAEALVALVAVGVWCWWPEPSVRQLCVYLASLATVTTFLFNANPLCRLDGYYLLSDLLGWPNLASHGQRMIAASRSRLLGGGTVDLSEIQPRWRIAAFCYGLAAATWRVTTLSTLASLAVLSYEGIGIVLVASIAAIWVGRSFGGFQRALRVPRIPLVFRGAVLALGIIGVSLMPWPTTVTAPGIVEVRERHVVRASAAGHVAELRVADGQWVGVGQTLAVLRNDELRLELARLIATRDQSLVKQRSLRSKRQLVELQVEESTQQTIEKQIAEAQSKVDGLTIRAPADGRVVARRLADLAGGFLSEGAEVCTIAGTENEFVVAIGERDVQAFQAVMSKSVEVHLPGQRITGEIAEVEPNASLHLAQPTLGAHAGGPLALKIEGNPSASDESWTLTEPRVTGRIRFVTATMDLLPGQRGYVAIKRPGDRLGTALMRQMRAWWDGLRGRAAAS